MLGSIPILLSLAWLRLALAGGLDAEDLEKLEPRLANVGRA
jgi:hypothetical protein